ncbi:hypothetical protein BJY04DRAFT_128617 [Aspergillus karnatakaensis]|uniref:uncharacterized protein n=1 Tax=Aspergillus karnatakaensis TaxID=1810916 RepID=UPI003CCE3A93
MGHSRRDLLTASSTSWAASRSMLTFRSAIIILRECKTATLAPARAPYRSPMRASTDIQIPLEDLYQRSSAKMLDQGDAQLASHRLYCHKLLARSCDHLSSRALHLNHGTNRKPSSEESFIPFSRSLRTYVGWHRLRPIFVGLLHFGKSEKTRQEVNAHRQKEDRYS